MGTPFFASIPKWLLHAPTTTVRHRFETPFSTIYKRNVTMAFSNLDKTSSPLKPRQVFRNHRQF